MRIKEELAGFAGGTLGYIHNNVPGAIKGYLLGKKLAQYSDSMAPIKRKLSYQDPTPRGWKRRATTSAVYRGLGKSIHKGPTYRPYRYRGGPYRSIGSNAAAVKNKRVKGVRHKKKKSLMITSKFKQKVHKALDEEIKGKYLKVMYRRMTPPALQNSQQTMDEAQIFMPLHFADAADVLFNRATATEIPTVAGLDWTNTYIRKDRILNSWVTYEAKNMSQRTYTLKMYVVKPKAKTPTNVAPNDAFADWIVGLQVANAGGTNPLNNTPNTLYCIPQDSPQFDQFWKAECTTVVLQPGNSHTFFIQGPSDYVIDYSKYVNKSITGGPEYMAAWGPFTRNVFFVAYADLVTSTLAGSGRFISGGAGVGGIVFEKKEFFSMACPESAGFKYPIVVAGMQQQLDNKLPCKVISVFPMGEVGAVQDILEENPITTVDPLD